MVLEKQDSGISLTSTDGQDGQRKMADGVDAARDLVKDQALLLSKSGQKFGGSDTKLETLLRHHLQEDKIVDVKDTASDNGITTNTTNGDIQTLSDNRVPHHDDNDDGDDDDLDMGRMRSVSDVGRYQRRHHDATTAATVGYTHERDDVRSEPEVNVNHTTAFSPTTHHQHHDHSAELREIHQRPIRCRNVVGRSQSLQMTSTSSRRSAAPAAATATSTSPSSYQRRRGPLRAMRLYEFDVDSDGAPTSPRSFDDDDERVDCSHSDLSAILGENDDDAEALVPLHKTVCCALCR